MTIAFGVVVFAGITAGFSFLLRVIRNVYREHANTTDADSQSHSGEDTPCST